MKNILRTFKYLFKNIVPLAIFALPAALFFAFKYNSSYFLDYLLKIGEFSDKTLFDIYGHFSFLPSFNFFWLVFWLCALLLSFSLMLSYIERHMKYGIKSFFKSFTSINYTLLAVLPSAICIIGVAEVFSFLLAVLINLLKLSLSPIVPVILPIIYVLMNFLAFTVISVFAMWVPIKIITGYRNSDALRYSIRLFQGRQIKLFLGLVFPMVVASPIMMVIKAFATIEPINTIIYVLFYILLLSYYAVFVMVSYFDYTGTYRKDIKVPLFPR